MSRKADASSMLEAVVLDTHWIPAFNCYDEDPLNTQIPEGHIYVHHITAVCLI